jgi:hypothetical protein
MKKKLLKFYFLFAPLCLCVNIFVLSGCVNVAEKAGRVLDGSAFNEKKTVTYFDPNSDLRVSEAQSKDGEKSILIEFTNFPMMKIRGTAVDEEKGLFYLTSLEYLGGSVNGWNEYTMDITGEGALAWGDMSSKTDSDFKLEEKIEKVEISSGRIHRYDTRITGAEAVTALRNRRQRVDALVEWMKTIEDAPKGQSLEIFEKYWKPFLFPETVQKKYRPENWQQETDVFSKAEDINWNTSYTERVFPEILHLIRNSGTMLRDWEEALSWIYMEYEWDKIEDVLSQEIVLRWIGWK